MGYIIFVSSNTADTYTRRRVQVMEKSSSNSDSD